MKIGIVGKGGSGKSTISWLLTQYIAHEHGKVLAIDADYNADLAHNLGIQNIEMFPTLNNSEKDLYEVFGMNIDKQIFGVIDTHSEPLFSISNKDSFTQKYATPINEAIDLMILGHHHYDALYSGRCSHAYAKSVKFYLPYVHLNKNEYIIVDSVAGTDMLGYGMHLGVDVLVCVVEDTPNSVGVYAQVKKIADMYNIPCYVVLNKKHVDHVVHAPHDYVASFNIDPSLMTYEYDGISSHNKDQIQKLFSTLTENITTSSHLDRLRMWREKHHLYVGRA